MQQNQGSENASNHDKRKDPQTKVSLVWTISSTATAIWIFLIVLFLLWIFLPDYVPDRTDRAKVFLESMFSLAIVIVVVVHAMMYFKQAKAMDTQSRISEQLATTAVRQFEITDRPWLAVDVFIVGPLTFNEQGTNLNCRIVAKNVGRSVAVNATINAKVFVPPLGGDVYKLVFAEQVSVCENVFSGIMSYAIFPNESFISDIGFGIGPEDLERGRLAGADFRTDFFQIHLVGCVDYQFSGHEKHHQTRFIYEVHRIDPNHPGARFGLSIGQDVPPEHLVLYKTIVGRGDYAD